MTEDELDKHTQAARNRMAEEFAQAADIPIIVMAWDPKTGSVSCSAGGFDPGTLPEFLHRSAKEIEQRQKAHDAGPVATAQAGRN